MKLSAAPSPAPKAIEGSNASLDDPPAGRVADDDQVEDDDDDDLGGEEDRQHLGVQVDPEPAEDPDHADRDEDPRVPGEVDVGLVAA